MKFIHLQKIASAVGRVDGFDLSAFDRINLVCLRFKQMKLQKARQSVDALVDEQPLWEYEGQQTSTVVDVMRVDLEEKPHDFNASVDIPTTFLLLSNEFRSVQRRTEWRCGWTGDSRRTSS